MEPCISCIYLTYCMEYVWKSSLWIGIFQRATQLARILLIDNIRSGGSCIANYYYSARWKLMLISDQAKDLFWRPGSHVSFSTASLHPGSRMDRLCESRKVSIWRFMWRKREFYGVIWRCFFAVLNVEISWVIFGSVVIAAKFVCCVIYRRC